MVPLHFHEKENEIIKYFVLKYNEVVVINNKLKEEGFKSTISSFNYNLDNPITTTMEEEEI